jgi:hypothetical protein
MAVKYIGDLDNDVMRGVGGASITISTPVQPDPPQQAQEGSLWYDAATGRMFMFSWGAWFQLF